MNIAIVGAGNMGSMHARILKNLPDCSLVGIAAKTADRAARVARELGIADLGSLQAIIDNQGIDVVDICTPTEVHAEHARACMEAGKHVIIEYPVCRDKKELNQLAKTSEKTGRVCAVAYYSRFQSQYAYFFELAKSDKIGKINHLSISRKSSPEFRTGDIINDLMAQDIDCMVRLLGMPKSFACVGNEQDSCVASFKYRSCTVTIEGITNMHEDYPFTTRHEVSGDNGAIVLDWSFRDRPKSTMTYSSASGSTVLVKEDYDPYAYELECIVKGIRNGNTADFDLPSVYDSALLAFECRRRMNRHMVR